MNTYVYSKVYRWWSLLIHRYGYHRMRVMYPTDEAGHVTAMARCDWCGMSAKAPHPANEGFAGISAQLGKGSRFTPPDQEGR